MFPNAIKAEDQRRTCRNFGRMAASIIRAGSTQRPADQARKDRANEDVITALDTPGGVAAHNVLLRKSAVDPMAVGAEASPEGGHSLAEYSRFGSVLLASARTGTGAMDPTLGVDAQPFKRNSTFAVQTSFALGDITGESEWKRATSFTTAKSQATEKKSTAIIAVTDSVWRHSPFNLAAFLEAEMRKAVQIPADGDFLNTVVTTNVASNGPGSAGDVLHDVTALGAAIASNEAAKLHLIVGPATAKALSAKPTDTGALAFPTMIPLGGTLAGIPVHVSDILTNSVMLIDASSFAFDPGVVLIDYSSQADIRLWDEELPDQPRKRRLALADKCSCAEGGEALLVGATPH